MKAQCNVMDQLVGWWRKCAVAIEEQGLFWSKPKLGAQQLRRHLKLSVGRQFEFLLCEHRRTTCIAKVHDDLAILANR